MTAAELRRVRLSLNLTQEQFAYRIGVTTSTFNRWERGHASPHKLCLQAIERAIEEIKQEQGK